MKRREFVGLLTAAPLAQMAQISKQAPRRRVVPLDAITRFKLRPTNNPYGPYVLGEDGKAYDFDDVVAVIFEMTSEHWKIIKK